MREGPFPPPTTRPFGRFATTSAELPERTATAYHEAGHAVAAYFLARPFVRVSIAPDEDSLGHVLYRRAAASFRPDVDSDARTRRLVERTIVCALAGPAAEHHHCGGGALSDPSAAGDLATAADMACYVCGSAEEAGAFVEWLRIRAAHFIAAPVHWRAVEVIARALEAHTTLRAAAVRRIVRQSLTPTPRA